MEKHILNHQHSNRKRRLQPLLGLALGCVFFVSCSSGNNDNTSQNEQPGAGDTTQSTATAQAPVADEGKGVGPVKAVNLGTGIDQALADKGKAVFESKCTACHKFGERYVGPDLAGVAERRKPEKDWRDRNLSERQSPPVPVAGQRGKCRNPPSMDQPPSL